MLMQIGAVSCFVYTFLIIKKKIGKKLDFDFNC